MIYVNRSRHIYHRAIVKTPLGYGANMTIRLKLCEILVTLWIRHWKFTYLCYAFIMKVQLSVVEKFVRGKYTLIDVRH